MKNINKNISELFAHPCAWAYFGTVFYDPTFIDMTYIASDILRQIAGNNTSMTEHWEHV